MAGTTVCVLSSSPVKEACPSTWQQLLCGGRWVAFGKMLAFSDFSFPSWTIGVPLGFLSCCFILSGADVGSPRITAHPALQRPHVHSPFCPHVMLGKRKPGGPRRWEGWGQTLSPGRPVEGGDKGGREAAAGPVPRDPPASHFSVSPAPFPPLLGQARRPVLESGERWGSRLAELSSYTSNLCFCPSWFRS